MCSRKSSPKEQMTKKMSESTLHAVDKELIDPKLKHLILKDCVTDATKWIFSCRNCAITKCDTVERVRKSWKTYP